MRAKRLKNNYKEVDGVLHYQKLFFVPKAIQTEFINQHYNNSLAGHFNIDKTKDFVSWEYYLPNLQKYIETYVKSCDVCLGLKVVRYKSYGNLQSLPVPTH